MIVFALLARQSYRDTIRLAETVTQRSSDVLHEHVQKVFETQELILDQVERLVAGKSWDAIELDPAIGHALTRLEQNRRQVASIWLLDATGRVRASSTDYKPGLNGADRDYFMAQQKGYGRTFIGRPYIGRTTGSLSFGFSRPRLAADGHFDGVIAISVSSDYFSDFFQDSAPDVAHVALLLRTDGVVLAREPKTPAAKPLAPDDPMMHGLMQSDHGLVWRVSTADGERRLYGYWRINGYPLAVGFAVGRKAVLQSWWREMIQTGTILAASGLGLILITVLALRRVHGEEAALLRLSAETEQRREVEQQLRQSQKLEALGQFTGSIAHDFNNLLNVILGNLEMVKNRPGDAKNPTRVEDALGAAGRGAALVRSLLTFARRQRFNMQVFDANAVIREMEPLLRHSLRDHQDAAFTLALAPDLWPVKTDVSQTEMAVLNLTVNARDAMPQGGTLTIATSNAHLQGDKAGLSGDYVRISVADSGSGMTAEVLSHAFEPFFTTKSHDKGTGLGLSAVHGFAKQSGGDVTIQSTLGKGTEVAIYLPRASGAGT